MALPVALKYCGGCDPAYDRVAAFEKIKQAAGDAVEWTRFEPGISRTVLMVCGCSSVCPAEEQDLSRVKTLVVLAEEPADPDEIVTRLLKDGDEND